VFEGWQVKFAGTFWWGLDGDVAFFRSMPRLTYRFKKKPTREQKKRFVRNIRADHYPKRILGNPIIATKE